MAEVLQAAEVLDDDDDSALVDAFDDEAPSTAVAPDSPPPPVRRLRSLELDIPGETDVDTMLEMSGHEVTTTCRKQRDEEDRK